MVEIISNNVVGRMSQRQQLNYSPEPQFDSYEIGEEHSREYHQWSSCSFWLSSYFAKCQRTDKRLLFVVLPDSNPTCVL